MQWNLVPRKACWELPPWTRFHGPSFIHHELHPVLPTHYCYDRLLHCSFCQSTNHLRSSLPTSECEKKTSTEDVLIDRVCSTISKIQPSLNINIYNLVLHSSSLGSELWPLISTQFSTPVLENCVFMMNIKNWWQLNYTHTPMSTLQWIPMHSLWSH